MTSLAQTSPHAQPYPNINVGTSLQQQRHHRDVPLQGADVQTGQAWDGEADREPQSAQRTLRHTSPVRMPTLLHSQIPVYTAHSLCPSPATGTSPGCLRVSPCQFWSCRSWWCPWGCGVPCGGAVPCSSCWAHCMCCCSQARCSGVLPLRSCSLGFTPLWISAWITLGCSRYTARCSGV